MFLGYYILFFENECLCFSMPRQEMLLTDDGRRSDLICNRQESCLSDSPQPTKHRQTSGGTYGMHRCGELFYVGYHSTSPKNKIITPTLLATVQYVVNSTRYIPTQNYDVKLNM